MLLNLCSPLPKLLGKQTLVHLKTQCIPELNWNYVWVSASKHLFHYQIKGVELDYITKVYVGYSIYMKNICFLRQPNVITTM